MMNNSDYSRLPFDTDECTSRGACTISPTNAALQELVMYILRLCVYYVLRLEDFNLENNNITSEIINAISCLVTVNEYGDKQMYELAQRCIHILYNTKGRYIKACDDSNITPLIADEDFLPNENSTLTEFILQGENLRKVKYIKNSNRYLSEILFIIQKSVCLDLSKLLNFDIFDNKSISILFNSLNIFNGNDFSNDDINSFINRLSEIDNQLHIKICEVLSERYGKISKVNVSHSSRKGKCILVSGNDFTDLINVLEITKDKNIDIYTHSNLLISHAFPKFRQYKNLKGHYGNSSENCIVDFATFPGAILLTKNTKNNTEYLYRGKIFSKDYITAQGVTKITNNDYSELIEASLSKKGFGKGKILSETVIGYNENEIIKKFSKIKNNAGKISHIYITGINAFSEAQKNYYSLFYKKLKAHEYVLSFYYGENAQNIIKADIGNYIPLAAGLLSKILTNSDLKHKITFMFTNCDVNTFSGIVYLYNKGYRNFYMVACPSRIVNPSVFKTFCEKYDIKIASKPDIDLKNIRKNNPLSE